MFHCFLNFGRIFSHFLKYRCLFCFVKMLIYSNVFFIHHQFPCFPMFPHALSFQVVLSFAAVAASAHDLNPLSLISLSTVLLHVSRGTNNQACTHTPVLGTTWSACSCFQQQVACVASVSVGFSAPSKHFSLFDHR